MSIFSNALSLSYAAAVALGQHLFQLVRKLPDLITAYFQLARPTTQVQDMTHLALRLRHLKQQTRSKF